MLREIFRKNKIAVLVPSDGIEVSAVNAWFVLGGNARILWE
jgi:hypothetical protein